MARRPNQNLSSESSESALLRTKLRLCAQFSAYLKRHGLSQRELAGVLGIDESVVSKILHLKTSEFTTDFLVKKLNALYSELEINIDAKE